VVSPMRQLGIYNVRGNPHAPPKHARCSNLTVRAPIATNHLPRKNMQPDFTPSISLWRGEFSDGPTELAYRADAQPAMARQLRTALCIWAGLMLLFALPDYQALGGSSVFWTLTAYRGAIVVLLLLGFLALRQRPHLAPQGYLTMWLEMVGFPFFFLFQLLRPELRSMTIAMVMIMNFSLFIFIPGRAIFGVWVSLLGITCTVAALVLTGTAAKLVPGLIMVLALPAVVGFLSANRLQRVQRQEFIVRSRLQQANAALQDEIARSNALQAELQRQATTDPLTGLLNRREFGNRHALDLSRALRNAEPLSIALIDLDHFKEINDRFGHSAGDEVLRTVAQLCHDCFRSHDSVGRIGGEEFAVLLPCATLQQAAMIAQRFIQRLAATPVVFGQHTIHLSATVGVAERLPDENMLDEMLQRADQALYAGKHAGRNCVMQATPHGPLHDARPALASTSLPEASQSPAGSASEHHAL
jgi:diguanylate cyclase (GGDEF)-like protein